MRRPIKIQVSIPTAGLVRMDFARSLAMMIGWTSAHGLPRSGLQGIEIRISDVMSANWFGNREQLVMSALKNEVTHIAFFDDDMSWHHEILDVLMEPIVKGGKRIVVSNYLVKRPECDRWVAGGLDGQQVPTLHESSGLQEIAYSGFGASVVDMRVFRDIPQPWFLPRWQDDVKTYTTEDVAFFDKARARGWACWLSHDASKMVEGHHGASAWHWTDYKPARTEA